MSEPIYSEAQIRAAADKAAWGFREERRQRFADDLLAALRAEPRDTPTCDCGYGEHPSPRYRGEHRHTCAKIRPAVASASPAPVAGHAFVQHTATLTDHPWCDHDNCGEEQDHPIHQRASASPAPPAAETDAPFGHCIHSMVKPDCASCLHGHWIRSGGRATQTVMAAASASPAPVVGHEFVPSDYATACGVPVTDDALCGKPAGDHEHPFHMSSYSATGGPRCWCGVLGNADHPIHQRESAPVAGHEYEPSKVYLNVCGYVVRERGYDDIACEKPALDPVHVQRSD